jgi:hypothetical protein
MASLPFPCDALRLHGSSLSIPPLAKDGADLFEDYFTMCRIAFAMLIEGCRDRVFE